jgi:hypothetical protein
MNPGFPPSEQRKKIFHLPSHKSSTHILYTHPLHTSSTHILYTHPLHTSSTHILYTHPIHTSSTRITYTNPLIFTASSSPSRYSPPTSSLPNICHLLHPRSLHSLYLYDTRQRPRRHHIRGGQTKPRFVESSRYRDFESCQNRGLV